MAEEPPGDGEPRKVGGRGEPLETAVGRRAERKLRARRHKPRAAWFGLGMFGLVGWSVAVPTLAGVALGAWLDAHTSGDVSWTLTFLIIGVALGCLHAWYWVKQESGRD